MFDETDSLFLVAPDFLALLFGTAGVRLQVAAAHVFMLLAGRYESSPAKLAHVGKIFGMLVDLVGFEGRGLAKAGSA